MRKIFAYIENTEVTLSGWLATVLGVVVVRAYLENFVGLREGSLLTTSFLAMSHFFLFWLMVALVLVLIVHFFTKKSIVQTSKIVLFGLPTLFLAPLIDFLLTGGKGAQMAYLIVDSGAEIARNFYTFWGYSPAPGVTIGMKAEILVILLVVFLYTRHAGGGWAKSLAATLVTYIAIFVASIIPSLLHVQNSYSWVMLMDQSLFGQNFFNSVAQFSSTALDYEMHFDGVILQVIYLTLIPLVFTTLYRWSAKKTLAVIRNSRPERVGNYFLMVGLGIFLAYHEGLGPRAFGQWLDITTVVILFCSYYFVWMFGIGVNDITDIKSDMITNTKRPLVKQTVTVSEMKSANLIFLSLALLGGYLVSHEVFFTVAAFASIAYIYSCPPLHLKRFAIVNSFLMALASLCAVTAGFFAFSRNPAVDAFPTTWLVLVILVYTLFFNVKDIKDIAADKKYGTYTIPVIFGEKRGKTIIWLMIAAILFCVPLLMNNPLFWLPSILAGAAAWFAIHRQPFKEKYVFGLYFLYVVSIVALYYLV